MTAATPRPSARHALALALAINGLATAPLLLPLPAQAQTAETRQTYNLSAGRLSDVLARYAAASGVTLSFDPMLLDGLRSQGLQGSYTLAEGFSTLLRGSNVELVHEGGSSYSLRRQSAQTTLPAVTVSAEVDEGGSAASAYRLSSSRVGALGDRRLQDTPFSISTYSREYMDNLQISSLADLTRYDAAVAASSDDQQSESALVIRGLSPDFDTGQKLDGLTLRSRASDLPLEHIERVDILKGAGAFLYGFGSPGGTINYVLKRPTEQLTRTLTTQVTDNGQVLLHGDIGGRFGDDKRFGYRINLVGQDGETYVSGNDSERKSASVALDWRLTPALTWQVDALYANRVSDGGYFRLLPNADGSYSNALGEPLDPIDGDKRLAPSWAFYESSHRTWGSDLNWDFADDWHLRLAYRYSDSFRNPYLPGLFADADGDYSAVLYHYNNLFTSEGFEGQVSGHLDTGPISHQVTVGGASGRTKSSNSNGLVPSTSPLGSGNLSNPQDFTDPGIRLSRSDADYSEYLSIKRTEVFASDTLGFGEQLDLILGVRHGTLDSKYGDYRESALTPSIALVYRPVDWTSLYVSYIEAFEQGAVAPDTAANAGEVFEPMTSEQHEIGVKMDRERWSASAALFRLERALTYTDASNVFSQDGIARYQGLELNTRGHITPDVLVGASAMWLDAENRKTSDPTLEGQQIVGTADQQYRLYGEYQIPNTAWVLSAGASHTGERSLDEARNIDLDAFTLYDLGARYAMQLGDTDVELKINLDNVTDEAYWLTTTGYHSLSQGMPRTLTLGTTLSF